jgi:PmbA protein
MKIDIDFAEDLLSRAVRGGADLAEVYLKSAKKLAVEVRNREVDSFKSSSSFGYSLRIIKNGCLGFAYSTDINERDSVLSSAVEAAAFSDQDIYLELPGDAPEDVNVEVFDSELSDIDKDEAVRRTLQLESSAYDEDKRINKVRNAIGSFSSSETVLVNSRKVKFQYQSTTCMAQMMAVAEEKGDNQVGWDFEGSRFLKDISFERVGKTAARRALQLLGSRKIRGTKATVLMDSSVAVDFLGIFASSLSAEAVQKGKSLLKNRLDKLVISSRIDMVDSGVLNGGLGSRPVDDEGITSREKVVIKEGVLRQFLYNTYTARKHNTVSTGNAVRSSFASIPSVGISNLYVAPASTKDVFKKNELPGYIQRGLFITDAMGIHTANPISGEFSIGVTGLWIEKGEVSFPVKEAVISGSIIDMFNKIEAIGDDLRFYGNLGAPSLVISDVDISA